MCHWRIESALIPLFTIPSTIFMIISMTTKSWVIGHMQSNRNIAVRISPWYLCSNHCVLSGHDKLCVGSRVSSVKGIQCFWIHDWSASGFRKYMKNMTFLQSEILVIHILFRIREKGTKGHIINYGMWGLKNRRGDHKIPL